MDLDADIDGYQMVKGCSTFFDARSSSLNPVTFSEIVNAKPGAELHSVTIMPNQPIERIKEWCRGIAMSEEEIVRTFGKDDFSTGRLTEHAEELEKKGERIWNVGKLLNTREGLTTRNDTLPGLWANAIAEPAETLPDGGQLRDYFGRQVTHADFEAMLDDYCDEHGLDIKKGVPTKDKLIELGLGELTEMLET